MPSANHFGNNVCTKNKDSQPENKLDFFWDQGYGCYSHDQAEYRQLKNNFPVHNKGILVKGYQLIYHWFIKYSKTNHKIKQLVFRQRSIAACRDSSELVEQRP